MGSIHGCCADRDKDAHVANSPRSCNCNHRAEFPKHPHTVVSTSQSIGASNALVPLPWKTEVSTGSLLFLHRRSDDSFLDSSCDYMYGDVFKGRKIHWECRVQITFTKRPVGRLVFGIMLDDYVPLNATTRYAMSTVVKALKYIVGDDVYHSTGDDPNTTIGEVEKPLFAMPMLAFDQIIVTPEGEKPPDMTMSDLSHMGIRRDRDKSKFNDLMRDFVPEVGVVYTLNCWSISRFLDTNLWKITGIMPGVSLDMNNFAGRPPIHVVIYSLQPEENDLRHVPSRQEVAFKASIWGSANPPPEERLQSLLGENSQLLSGRLNQTKDLRQPRVEGSMRTWSWFGACGKRLPKQRKVNSFRASLSAFP